MKETRGGEPMEESKERELPAKEEKEEFVVYVRRLVPELQAAIDKDDFETIDKIIIDLKSKAKSLGFHCGSMLSREFNEVWAALADMVHRKLKERGIEYLNPKETNNILARAFRQDFPDQMQKGLKYALENWLENESSAFLKAQKEYSELADKAVDELSAAFSKLPKGRSERSILWVSRDILSEFKREVSKERKQMGRGIPNWGSVAAMIADRLNEKGISELTPEWIWERLVRYD